MKVLCTTAAAPQLAQAFQYKVYFQKRGDPTLCGSYVQPCNRPPFFNPQNQPPTTCPYNPMTMPTFALNYSFNGFPVVDFLLPGFFPCEWATALGSGPASAVLTLSSFLGVPAWHIAWVDLSTSDTGDSYNLTSVDGTGNYTPDSHWTNILVF